MKHERPRPETMLIELFVQGQSARSSAALEVVRRVCEERLRGRYQLDVIDIQQQPDRISDAGIIAAPALVRRRPEPVLRTIGHLTEARVLNGLGLDGRSAGRLV